MKVVLDDCVFFRESDRDCRVVVLLVAEERPLIDMLRVTVHVTHGHHLIVDEIERRIFEKLFHFVLGSTLTLRAVAAHYSYRGELVVGIKPVAYDANVVPLLEAQRLRIPILFLPLDQKIFFLLIAEAHLVVWFLLELFTVGHLERHDVEVFVVERVEAGLVRRKAHHEPHGVVVLAKRQVQFVPILFVVVLRLTLERLLARNSHINCLMNYDDHQQEKTQKEQDAATDGAGLVLHQVVHHHISLVLPLAFDRRVNSIVRLLSIVRVRMVMVLDVVGATFSQLILLFDLIIFFE